MMLAFLALMASAALAQQPDYNSINGQPYFSDAGRGISSFSESCSKAVAKGLPLGVTKALEFRFFDDLLRYGHWTRWHYPTRGVASNNLQQPSSTTGTETDVRCLAGWRWVNLVSCSHTRFAGRVVWRGSAIDKRPA